MAQSGSSGADEAGAGGKGGKESVIPLPHTPLVVCIMKSAQSLHVINYVKNCKMEGWGVTWCLGGWEERGPTSKVVVKIYQVDAKWIVCGGI